jgi:LEA14-like dessication related protein
VHFDGATPVLTVGLVVENTSNQSMTIKSLVGNLYANGYNVGHLSAFDPQEITPNSQSVISIDIRMGLLGIVNDIIRAVQYGNFTQDLQLTGYANVDNLQVPIDEKYKAGA